MIFAANSVIPKSPDEQSKISPSTWRDVCVRTARNRTRVISIARLAASVADDQSPHELLQAVQQPVNLSTSWRSVNSVGEVFKVSTVTLFARFLQVDNWPQFSEHPVSSLSLSVFPRTALPQLNIDACPSPTSLYPHWSCYYLPTPYISYLYPSLAPFLLFNRRLAVPLVRMASPLPSISTTILNNPSASCPAIAVAPSKVSYIRKTLPWLIIDNYW